MRGSMVIAASLALGVSAPVHSAAFFSDLASFQAAVPSATLIEDFESVSGAQLDTPLPSLARASGTYVGLAGSPFPNVFVSSPGYTNYGAGNNPTTSKILTANGDESFSVALGVPTNALGMNLFLNDFGDATLSYFDAADSFLGSITFLTGADNFQFSGFQADPGVMISRFTFVSVGGGTLNTGIDNIYAESAVPEPATWMMMILGFGLIGATMRRKAPRATAIPNILVGEVS